MIFKKIVSLKQEPRDGDQTFGLQLLPRMHLEGAARDCGKQGDRTQACHSLCAEWSERLEGMLLWLRFGPTLGASPAAHSEMAGFMLTTSLTPPHPKAGIFHSCTSEVFGRP